MNYHNITKDDMLNGDGLRTVLWVAGCTHHCHNCQNPITWDEKGGLKFDDEAKQTEIKDNSVILTPEEAIKRAELLSVSKINEKLDSDERIINYKVLSTEIKEDCIILNVFFSIYENITDYSKIEGDNFVTS